MDKIKLTYDKEKLVAFMEEIHIAVPVLATPYKHKVILVEPFLMKVQELSGLTKEEFQKYLDETGKGWHANSIYERDDFIDKCIKQIRYPGVFKTYGYEKVEPNPYIYLHLVLDK